MAWWVPLLLVVSTLAQPVAAPKSAAAQGQTTAGSDGFSRLLAEGQQAYSARRWNDAALKFQALADLGRARHDELWEARGIAGLGSVLFQQAHYPDARRLATQAATVFERLKSDDDIGRVANLLGNVARMMGDTAEARAQLERAVAAFQAARDEAAGERSEYNLAQIEINNLPACVARLDSLLRRVRERGDDGFQADILQVWGDALFAHGNYDESLDRLEQAAVLANRADDRDRLARIDNSLGRVYRVHGQPTAALEYQLRSLAIQRTLNSPLGLIQSLNAVGVAYENLGDTRRARQHYEEALALAEKTGSPRVIDFMRGNLGHFLVESGDVERGTALLQQVVAGGADVFRSTRYDQLSSAYYVAGRYAEARETAQKALDLCRQSEARDPTDCLHARLARADAALAMGDGTGALEDERAVLADIESEHRQLAPSDFMKLGYAQLWQRVYSLTIELQTRQGASRDALATAELARSRAFLDLLASRNLARPSPSTIASLRLRGGSAPALRSDAVVKPPSVADLTTVAARLHSTLLQYWVGQDKVYIWVLSPNGTVHAATTAIRRSRLDALVRSTVAFAPGGTAPTPSRGDVPIRLALAPTPAWSELYELLIKPIERQLPRTPGARLTIVPHGPLFNVAFAALRDARGRYLIERYTIHSVPAAAILQFTARERRSTARAGSMLLVADPSPAPRITGEPPLPRLPGAVAETRAIAELVPAARATVLSGARATEPAVTAALAHKAVVHFATHAIVRDADPLSSFLVLGRAAGASGELTMDKIYGLKLDADLVVLSACRSGGGVITGDGIAGLARAFFYAGTPSLVVSLWDVADAPTSRLLPAFYRAWLRGADKDRALRAAQLGLIRDLRAGRVVVRTAAGTVVVPEDPAFWAGFVLLGEPN